MYQWNSDKLKAAFSQISGISYVTVNRPGGDVDSDNIMLDIKGTRDHLFVAGFHTTDYDIWKKDTSDVEVEMIELSDGLCSSGGLNSKNSDTARVYMEVRQFLVDDGADVVDSMSGYF